VTRADQARAFAISRAEAVEAAAALELAAACGTAKQIHSDRVAVIVDRLVAILTRLIRWRSATATSTVRERLETLPIAQQWTRVCNARSHMLGVNN
jgi:hypothetical protein